VYRPRGVQQLGRVIGAFNAYKPEKNATVATVARELNSLQNEVGYIDVTERPSKRMKIERLF